MELPVNFSSPVVANPRAAHPDTSRGARPASNKPAHGVMPREGPRYDGVGASREARLRALWTPFEAANALIPAHETEVDAQARTIPRDRRVDFHLASRCISWEGAPGYADLRDLPDLFVALVILATLRKHGPRAPISLKNLSSLVEKAHEVLYDTPLCCSENTLRRRFRYLNSHHAGLAGALLPGLVRTTPRAEDVSASDLFAGIDVSEQLIEQVEVLPDQRWVLVDICQNLVFVQGAEPYRCPQGIEIAHLCMVLNAYRAGGDNWWIKCQSLIEDMTTVHNMFFGAWWETSPETLARRVALLNKSSHPLREWIVSEPGCCGGYALRTPWATSMTT